MTYAQWVEALGEEALAEHVVEVERELVAV
jgi:hypothetical protein